MPSRVLVLMSEEDADPGRIETLTGLLRADLLQLDVEDVSRLRSAEAPPGTRGLDVAEVGSLVVLLGQSATSLGAVVGTVRAWLSRSSGSHRSIRIEIGGDVLELSEASDQDQDQLVSLFVSRHAGRKGERWPGDEP